MIKASIILSLILAVSTAMSQAPASTPTPQTVVQSKPDTEKVLKARLKSYKIQSKAAIRLAKAQMKAQVEQLHMNNDLTRANKLVTVEQAKQ
jgi:hypothetical protein